MKPSDHNREQRVRDALQGLPPVAADAEFQERLARRFVEGELRATRTPRRARRSPARVALLWAALVLVLAIPLAFFGLQPEQPIWSFVSVTGEGPIELGSEAVSVANSETWGHRLRSGLRVRVPDSAELTVASRDGMVLQLTAGTEMTLPASGRWPWQGAWRSKMTSGEARITTGPDFRGRSLWIDSLEARIEVTGTTLAVIRVPSSTCVCVFRGRVRMGPAGGELRLVEEGKRRLLFSDGQPERTEDILPMESMKLQMLLDQRETMLPE